MSTPATSSSAPSVPTLAGMLAVAINALLGVLVAFGVDLTPTQIGAVLAAFNGVAGVAVYIVHVVCQKTRVTA